MLKQGPNAKMVLNVNPPDGRVLSFLDLRKSVGIIGIALPPVLVSGCMLFGGGGIEGSISAYYYTNMRNVLVGALCALALFLFSYMLTKADNVVGNLAGLGALGVALFPTTQQGESTTWISRVHLASAALLFACLFLFCVWLFRRRLPGQDKPQWPLLDKLYIVCGVLIVAPLLTSAILGIAGKDGYLFWTESIAIWAFGIAWFVKGFHSALGTHDPYKIVPPPPETPAADVSSGKARSARGPEVR